MTSFALAADLQTFMGFRNIDEARATALLEDAAGIIRQHLDQIVDVVEDDPIRMNPSFTRRLFLPERPVTAVSSVIVDGIEIIADAFKFESYGVLRRVDGDIWEADAQGIHITYTHGYAVIPSFIVTICKAVAGRALASAPPTSDAGDVPSEVVGFAPGIFLTPGEREKLDTLKPTVFA